MILGFKDRFVPYVLDGSKTHTIRGGERWSVGMRADLFKNVRQKNMKLIFRANVMKVEAIRIVCDLESRPDGWPSAKLAPLSAKTNIYIEESRLDESERNLFAWRDGFRWRTEPCAHCCNWGNCDELTACRNDTRDTYRGFPFQQMVEFWRVNNGFGKRVVEFGGQIIHWDYENRHTVGPRPQRTGSNKTARGTQIYGI